MGKAAEAVRLVIEYSQTFFEYRVGNKGWEIENIESQPRGILTQNGHNHMCVKIF